MKIKNLETPTPNKKEIYKLSGICPEDNIDMKIKKLEEKLH